MDEMNSKGKMCGCPHHKVVPLSIMLIGVVFLPLHVLSPMAVSVIWPILLVIIGGTKLGSSGCKCC